jgi:nucleotide-binding universal stress UspA family protein
MTQNAESQNAESQTAMQNIVVGIDDSEGARTALEWAIDMATTAPGHGSNGETPTLTVVAAWCPPAVDTQAIFDDAPFRDAATQLLETLSESYPTELRIESVARRGHPVEVLLSEADARDADLIVVGSRGRSSLAQVMLGSVSRSVAARAGRPVAVIPSPAMAETPGEQPRPTVVGYDDSPGSRAAIAWALENLDGPITALAAWVLPSTAIYDPLDIDVERYTKATEERLLTGLQELCGDEIDERITPVVQYLDPRTALVNPALRPSTIVVGARSRTGLRGLLLGSTVTYVATHSPVPVIVIPPDGCEAGE